MDANNTNHHPVRFALSLILACLGAFLVGSFAERAYLYHRPCLLAPGGSLTRWRADTGQYETTMCDSAGRAVQVIPWVKGATP